MFNSFLDGTKSAIDMVSGSSGCVLKPLTSGLKYPPCAVWDLPKVLKPDSKGGQCENDSTVEVDSCMNTHGPSSMGSPRGYLSKALVLPFIVRIF